MLAFISFRVLFTTLLSTLFILGQNNTRAPDFKKAKEAAARIQALINRQPTTDNLSEEGTKPQVRQIYF